MNDNYKFTFLEDIATADLAFEAKGKDEQELFQNCLAALASATINVKKIGTYDKNKPFDLKADSREQLLYSFLSEAIYLKDAEEFVAIRADIKITEEWKLQGEFKGVIIDRSKHDLRNDIKAITKHMFTIKETDDVLTARVIVDV